MTEYIFVAGAGEQNNANQLGARLVMTNARFAPTKSIFVQYANKIGPVGGGGDPLQWKSLASARVSGLIALGHAIRQTPNVPWLVGYSLGAYVISDLLEKMAQGQYQDLEIAGVLLIASPRTAWASGETGIAGRHLPYPRNIPIHELRNSKDIVCRVKPGSAFLKLPKLIDMFLSRQFNPSPEVLAWFIEAFVSTLHRPPNEEEIRAAMGYMNGTQHSREYFEPWAISYVRRVLP